MEAGTARRPLQIVQLGFGILHEAGGQRPLPSEEVGYVLSTPVVPEFLTAREIMKFYLDINQGKIESPQTPDQYLDSVLIEADDRNKLLRDYSHGMKNKIQMLLNLMADPKVLLLDEPLTSLDVVAQDEIKTVLKKRKAGHITILSTHILELALDVCDEVVILHNGLLSLIDRGQLDNEEYKARILAALREEESND